MTHTEPAEVLLAEIGDLLAELYPPAGMLIFWSSPVTYLDHRRPCDLWCDHDSDALTTLRNRLQALTDGPQ